MKIASWFESGAAGSSDALSPRTPGRTESFAIMKPSLGDAVGGMINTSRQIGTAVGAALLPAVAGGVSGGVGVFGDRGAMFTAALAR